MNDLDFKKRLLYRSVHRGCKETDILLGEFALAQLNNLSPEELNTYAELLEVNDVDIYNWLTETTQVPALYDTDVFKKIKNFNAER